MAPESCQLDRQVPGSRRQVRDRSVVPDSLSDGQGAQRRYSRASPFVTFADQLATKPSMLETRVAALEARPAELEQPAPGVPRLFLLEGEYAVTLARAEIRWLRGVVADVRDGKLAFPTVEEMLRISAHAGGPSEEAVRRMVAEMSSGVARGDLSPRAGKARRATPRRSRPRGGRAK